MPQTARLSQAIRCTAVTAAGGSGESSDAEMRCLSMRCFHSCQVVMARSAHTVPTDDAGSASSCRRRASGLVESLQNHEGPSRSIPGALDSTIDDPYRVMGASLR
jgi:hypothetical protein